MLFIIIIREDRRFLEKERFLWEMNICTNFLEFRKKKKYSMKLFSTRIKRLTNNKEIIRDGKKEPHYARTGTRDFTFDSRYLDESKNVPFVSPIPELYAAYQKP